MTAVLTVKDITVRRGGRCILQVDSFFVQPKEVVALIGPNGAGKSTLLTILACLALPDRGELFFANDKVTRKNALAVRRRLAVVFQDPLLLDCTVLENAALGLKLRGQKQGAKEKALRWLKRFGVDHLANQNALTLSGGEAQRVSLARAFALEPEVLLLDEPFVSIDVISRKSLVSEFKSVLTGTGTTAVLVTHDFQEVLALANRAVVLDQGKIRAQGTPQEIASHEVWGSLTRGIGLP
ncbi:MAG: ATP-binding cassette domain-containing protein [Firmicutes bacterium]|nr:ATP-binding cassette domain-containing protein [Bacillota bacterium]